jgi:hypothetical protein
MLHPVNPPTCTAQMASILNLQFKVLAFACNPRTLLPLNDPNVFRTEFGAAGNWLYDKLTTTKRGVVGRVDSDFHLALRKLIQYLQTHPIERREILRAYLNDTKFHLHHSNAAFRFGFMSLDPLTQEAVRPLMRSFYDNFLKNGFPQSVHGGAAAFDRDALVKSFWDANPKLFLCSACDGAKPDEVDGKVYADADHFLPQSKYPFLCVHLGNLLPICKVCNQSLKGSKDPINDHTTEPLIHSFHPYLRPASQHIKIRITRSPGVERKLRIRDFDGSNSRRVKNFNRVLKLEQRWVKRTTNSAHTLIINLRSQLQLERRIKTYSKTRIDTLLRTALRAKEIGSGQMAGSYLDAHYIKYALSDSQEMDFLHAEINKA